MIELKNITTIFNNNGVWRAMFGLRNVPILSEEVYTYFLAQS
jgi:hypothetical protein